jgi:hypothetical protein
MGGRLGSNCLNGGASNDRRSTDRFEHRAELKPESTRVCFLFPLLQVRARMNGYHLRLGPCAPKRQGYVLGCLTRRHEHSVWRAQEFAESTFESRYQLATTGLICASLSGLVCQRKQLHSRGNRRVIRKKIAARLPRCDM